MTDKKVNFNICFAGMADPEGTASWDKTTKAMIDHIGKIAGSNSYVQLKPYESKLNKLFHTVYSKLLMGRSSFRDPFINGLLVKSLEKNLKEKGIDPDVIFFSSLLLYSDSLADKKLYTYTDASITEAIKYGIESYGKRYLKYFAKYSKEYGSKLQGTFTFNEWTKRALIEHFDLDEKKIFNVGFGAHLDPYKGEKDYTNKQLLIVLRRGLEERKGLNLLLEAFKIAKQKDKDLKLAVVGTTLDKIDGVEYYEGKGRDLTISLFQKASLYTMPALYEPNGMVYPEALASKTPILGLDRCAFPEFAGGGKYGFIVKPDPQHIAETILEAVSNPNELEKMGTEGQRFATDRYNWNNVANKIISIIEADYESNS
jgi:glycosyltransferase involved in cell wall biosynthesis